MVRRLGSIVIIAGLVVTACQAPAPPTGIVPDGQMSMNAGNYSDRALELVVNDMPIALLPAATRREFTAGQLPALPWHAELRLPAGRSLLEVTFASGSVIRTATGSRSPAARADLSCGRIELWSGYPLIGPAPGPGVPGDCDP